jgi:outer membrane protein
MWKRLRKGCWINPLMANVAGIACLLSVGGAAAETLGEALVTAYAANPEINQQRASVRVADEEIPKVSSNYRPTVTTEGGSPVLEFIDKQVARGIAPPAVRHTNPRGLSATATQKLWDGGRTPNLLRERESNIFAERAKLRAVEQNVLMSGVTAYMNVLHDAAALSLYRSHVDLLKEQLQEVEDRFTAGEVTETDIAQVKAALAYAIATALSAQSTLQTSVAEYRRLVGHEPAALAPVKPLETALPRTLAEALSASTSENPLIEQSLHDVDAAVLQVKVDESRLAPTVGLTGLVDRRFNAATDVGPRVPFSASVTSTVTLSVYDGGAAYALIRQDKEKLSQQELESAHVRDSVYAAVTTAWGKHTSATPSLDAERAKVDASEVALIGVREEAKIGERTVLDELVAEQSLLRARIDFISAQRDEVTTSYQVLNAIGKLTLANLGLRANGYDPRTHLLQVQNKWFGLRTPDGR